MEINLEQDKKTLNLNNILKEKEQKIEEFKTHINSLQKEKSTVIEENNKLKQDLEKQKNSMEIFKKEFNIKKEIFEKTAKELNLIKQRNELINGKGNKKNKIDKLINELESIKN